MARKKITLAFTKNKTNRKASFRKRRKGLIKKVKEIITLCNVEACAISFSPYDESTIIWPSPEGALAVLKHYGAAVSGIHHRPPKWTKRASPCTASRRIVRSWTASSWRTSGTTWSGSCTGAWPGQVACTIWMNANGPRCAASLIRG
ncbi:mads-box transcription factor pheres 2 [Phtheirospermum japonicum]|uniref:Mads-box transcription factor pheres 2 n=1 Tax=Phtheirospermum japonicum TaxID=374723 RepID=A0A830B2L4_9LAMI|nr:mads-box transcription factor pheres 2 [Phtheirospermum japonicum]